MGFSQNFSRWTCHSLKLFWSESNFLFFFQITHSRDFPLSLVFEENFLSLHAHKVNTDTGPEPFFFILFQTKIHFHFHSSLETFSLYCIPHNLWLDFSNSFGSQRIDHRFDNFQMLQLILEFLPFRNFSALLTHWALELLAEQISWSTFLLNYWIFRTSSNFTLTAEHLPLKFR